MDIKNLFAKVSGSSGKIKIAALAGFICVAIIGIGSYVSALYDETSYNNCVASGGKLGCRDTNTATCNDPNDTSKPVYDLNCRNSVGTGSTCTLDSNNKCSGYKAQPKQDPETSATTQTTTATQKTVYFPREDGEACPCGANYSGPCVNGVKQGCRVGYCVAGKCNPQGYCEYSESNPKGANNECKDETYCFEGTNQCAAGCLGYGDDGVARPVEIGKNTCLKPQVGSWPSVYACGETYGLDNNGGYSQVLKWPEYDNNYDILDNSFWKTSYSLNVVKDKECYDSGCTYASGIADCGENGKCVRMATAIRTAHAKYLAEKSNFKNTDIEKGQTKSKGQLRYDSVRKSVEGILNTAGFSATKMIADNIEKIALEGRDVNGINGAARNDGTSMPFVGSEIDIKDISCLYSNAKDAVNWDCPTEAADQFLGFAYECVDVDGCKMRSWVNGVADPCDNVSSNIWAYDEFQKSGWGKYSNDNIKWCEYDLAVHGGRINGCGYSALVMPTTYNESNAYKNEYKEVFKVPTGKCWDLENDVTEKKCDGKSSVLLPETPSVTAKGFICDADKKVYETTGNGKTLIENINQCGGYDDRTVAGRAYAASCARLFSNPNSNCFGGESGTCSVSSCSNDSGCESCGSNYICAFKNKTDTEGECAILGQTACKGSAKNYLADTGVHFCSSSSYYYCKQTAAATARWWEDQKCVNGCEGDKCKGGTGKTDCSTPQSCLAGANDCDVCGDGWKCVLKEEAKKLNVSVLGISGTIDYSSTDGDGVCVKDNAESVTGDCVLSGINKGTPSSSNAKCKKGGTFGVYVPFTLSTKDNCSGDNITCTVTNDYDSSTATPIPVSAGSSSWAACVFPKSSSNSSSDGTKGSNPSTINFTVSCTDGKTTKTATEGCKFPSADDNAFQKAEEAEQASTTAAEEAEEEQAKEDKTAPKVTVSSPSSGSTVKEKTAELKATTDINATCTYGDSVGSATGMTMSGDGGTTHTATISSLENNLTSCKASHTITVTCKNSKATSGATGATGTGTTNFTVDLSGNSEYKPTVSSAMDSSKFTIANPVLKVATNRAANCEYKEGSSFTFGSGKKFDTTGSYSHNTQLSGLTSKDYDYYVVCEDKDVCAASSGDFKVEFAVDLAASTTIAIVNTTPENQTIANPTLSVSTVTAAACKYKKDNAFVYDDGTGTQFSNDGSYSHTLSLSSYGSGTFKFYVACKDLSTGAMATYGQAITTTIGTITGPVISNTTASAQTTSKPTLSIITAAAANCQYNKGADFTYGAGTQFSVDGSTGHSSVLPVLADGTYTYYVVCKDASTGVINSAGTQIIFTVSAGSAVCAKLSSNDKQNDSDRDYSDDDGSESDYLWRSVEEGERDKFASVDWYGGYQFTPDEDGQVTQLCGYFDDGESNKVTLYNSSYKALATATISGEDDWKCVSVSPAPVKADKRYYVIGRFNDAPIYYEYKSGMLPLDADNATVESGVRQLAEDDFGHDLKKYDYMVFGLVDVKINFTGENTDGPEVDSASPVGSTDSDTVISVETDIDASCKFDRDDVEYGEMRYTFGNTGATSHEQKVCNLDEGDFTWYVRCKGTTGTNDGSTLIQFEVSD